jgi:hypothetical protein
LPLRSKLAQLVEKVVIGAVGSPKPHPNTYTSRPKHCNGGVFEPLKETRKRCRGVFQQAGALSEVRPLTLWRIGVAPVSGLSNVYTCEDPSSPSQSLYIDMGMVRIGKKGCRGILR